MRVVLATHNVGKIREFTALLKPFTIEIIPQAELGVSDIEETGLSFIENALLKARHACKQTGLPALADDSGLAVSYLQGEPGIFSARYAGLPSNSKNNIAKLLSKLSHVPDEKRDAQFHCILAFMRHESDPTPIICDGKWCGRILHHPQGEQGFGYDPIFYVPEENKSAAELSLDVKNKISHRALAFNLLVKAIAEEKIE